MKYAVAVLNIKPREFWELTLAEYNVMMEAHLWKEEREMERLAVQAQWNMLPHVKPEKIPSVNQLLGKKDEEEEKKETTTKEDLEEMKRSMGM